MWIVRIVHRSLLYDPIKLVTLTIVRLEDLTATVASTNIPLDQIQIIELENKNEA